ncbi:MAG: glycoside hydrolase family 3 C-terminal domain-containing protein, partial [Mangrovibacterium sp.]|nr:glycoside hydrolase family 3 C-terminal domain-containing protein [Mangrovibacterium sp.]
RTQETYGEDPFLASRLGVAFVKGLQGNDPDYLKVVATPKHYTANNEEHNRFECNALFSERSLREYYLVPFEYAVKEGKAVSIMSAYNAINGMPCTISKKLLTDILRNEWGFNGYAVSDCGGPSLIVDRHHYFQTYDSAAVACIQAGLDLECGTFVYRDYLKVALDKGWIKESQIDTAVSRVLKARFRMGAFDRDLSANPYNRISPSVVGCEKHQQLALEAARQSLVLLKNKDRILPLDRSKLKKIAVFGPNAANCVFGDYSAKESANEPVSVIQGLESKLAGKAEIIHYPWTNKYDQEFVIIPKEYLRTEDGGKTGLSAEYYRNIDLQGEPLRRVDEGVNFNPAQQAPDPDVPSGKRSIRWKGLIVPKVTGKYTLVINSDDGVRLFLDDKVLVDEWKSRSNTTDYVEIGLEAGKSYRLRLDYFDEGGNAIAQLRWKTPDTQMKDVFKAEKEIAANADIVIAVLGLNTSIEAEGTDKKQIELPEDQQRFMEEIHAANPRTIVVLETGSPLAIPWIEEHIPAVLCAWYAGEQGGNAIADVLFGDYNPAGRLPLTFYKSTGDLLPFDDYEIMKGRTYMYAAKKPLYPFGFGLSYTRFEYSGLKESEAVMGVNDQAEVSVSVKNTGNYDGDEVVQAYVKNLTSTVPQPIRALKGFERISLKKGEAKLVTIPLKSEAFRYFDEAEDRFVVEPGTYEIQIGTSSEDIRLRTRIEVK